MEEWEHVFPKKIRNKKKKKKKKKKGIEKKCKNKTMKANENQHARLSFHG